MRTLVVLIAIALLAFPACDDADNGEEEEATEEEVTQEDDDEVGEEEAEEEEELSAVEGRIELSQELDDEQMEAADELADFQWSSISREDRTAETAPLLLELAARNDDPEVTTAALSAMTEVFRPEEDAEKGETKPVDDDYKTLILAHLRSDDDEVLAAAINAARHLLADAEVRDEEVTQRLISLANSDRPEVVYDAIDVLSRASDWEEDPELVEVFAQGIEHSEAFVVSGALSTMRHKMNLDEAADELWDPVYAATKHDDPGVRGRALDALARLPGFGFTADEELTEKVGERAAELLDDDHPFVRSRAAYAVGRVDHLEAIPTLVEMTDDHTENRYNLEGWTELDGSPGRIHHDGSGWSRVSDAALNALQSMNVGDFDQRFDYDSPGIGEDTEEHLAGQSEAAHAWFEENEAAIMGE